MEEEENYVCFANSINNESDVVDFKLSSDDFNVLWKFSGIDLGNAKDVTYDHELKKGNRYYTEADTPSDQIKLQHSDTTVIKPFRFTTFNNVWLYSKLSKIGGEY